MGGGGTVIFFFFFKESATNLTPCLDVVKEVIKHYTVNQKVSTVCQPNNHHYPFQN